MQIQTVQTAFAATPPSAPATALSVSLPRPTVVGNTLTVSLRFSPLTGTPQLADSYANRFRLTASNNLDAVHGLAWFTADLVRAGANHTLTATAQGGPQTLELAAAELSVLAHVRGAEPTPLDVLLALLVEQHQTNALLQRLVTAERA